MPTATVNGLNIAYELHGEGDPVAITPGGRFSKDTKGVRELAEALAEGGKKVLIWDRPNSGGSDICYDGDFESNMHADTLAGLIQELGLGKTIITGGSAGSRVSLLTVLRHPEVASKLCIWWITGGFFGLMGLASYYCGQPWTAAKKGGMEAVVTLPEFQENLTKNPRNRDRLLAMDPEEFAAVMERWGPNFLQPPDSPFLVSSPQTLPGSRFRLWCSGVARWISPTCAARANGCMSSSPARGWSSRRSVTTSGASSPTRRRRRAKTSSSKTGRSWPLSSSSS